MDTYTFTASDQHRVQCYRWLPTGDVRQIVQIAHGMGEHAARYDDFAGKLCDQGCLVVASDHRGHGKTAEILGDFGEDGWNRTLKDMLEINRAIRAQYPGTPVVLFGHSMGAMLTQHYLCLYGESVDAAILSGSPGFSSWLPSVLIGATIQLEIWRLGPKANSDRLQALLFGKANTPFESDGGQTSGFEWLSRDATEVQKYIDDPLCGFVPCCISLQQVFAGARQSSQLKHIRRIPKIPILLFSGTEDPVHGERKNIDRLLQRYRAAGLSVATRFYAGGRHEMLNETNKDEVIADVTSWLLSLRR